MRAMRELFITKGRGKRTCSILTALAMTLSLFAGIGATSFAEEDVPEVNTEAVAEELSETKAETGSEEAPKTVPEADVETATGEEQANPLMDGADENKTPIDTVNVDITIPKAGAADATIAYSSADQEKYTVTAQDIKWRNAYGVMATSFVSGNDYYMSFTVTPEDEYALTPNTRVLVNGTEENVNRVGGDSNPASQFEFTCRPQVDGYIYEVNLPDVPEAPAGKPVTPYSYSSPDGKYKATGTWFVYDKQTKSYQQVDNSHTFTKGKNYKLDLDMIPNVGYVVAEGCMLNINGEEQGNFTFDGNGISIDPIYFGTGEEIIEVAVDEASIPKATVGKKFADKMINIKAPAGSNYTLAGYWIDEDGNRSGTFTKGKAYYFNLVIYAKDGYYLAKDLGIRIGDEWEWVTSESAFAEHQIRQSLAQMIDQVTLKNLPKAKIGAAIPAARFAVSVPSGANYAATGIWRDETGAQAVGTFQKGKAYTLEVDIIPEDGYELSRPLIIVADGVKHKVDYNSYDGVLFSKTTSFRQEIKKVELTGLTEPKAGAMPDTKVSIPSGAPYIVGDITWTSTAGGALNEEVSGTFASGKAYQACIRIKPKAGYEFTESTVVTLNGKEVRIYESYDDWFEVTEDWSLEKVITNIKVNNVPTMKIGQKTRNDITISKDAKYNIGWADWFVWNDEISRWEPFSGTFKKGKAYRFDFTVFPKEGYCFSEENTKFYINGKKRSGEIIGPYDAVYTASYSVGMKVIDKVEFHVAEPKTGNHCSIEPVITTADGARYSVDVDKAYWMRRPGESNEVTYQIFDEYFREGIDYGVQFGFFADAGYVFSDDLTIIVNGRILEAGDFIYDDKNGSITVFFNDLAYKKAAVDKVNGAGTDTGGIDTGDDDDMLPWVILASASLMAAAGVMLRRKIS